MAQLPHIAMFCHEDTSRLHSLALGHFLPLVAKCLADNDNLVRLSVPTFINYAEPGMANH
jgi:hypothetical protein